MSDHDPQLHWIAGLIGEPSRSTMLLSLMGGQQLTAGDLAKRSHIAPATASEHLKKLVAGGLVRVLVHGRHRYYRLASSEVASMLEGIMALAPPNPVRSLRESTMTKQLHLARTCYDHLAGSIGMTITEAMLKNGWLITDPATEMLAITNLGHQQFATWKLPLEPNRQRPMIRSCLDWSERRYHVAGQLGAVIAQRFFTEEWIMRGGSGRVVQVTESGVSALKSWFGIFWPPATQPQKSHYPS